MKASSAWADPLCVVRVIGSVAVALFPVATSPSSFHFLYEPVSLLACAEIMGLTLFRVLLCRLERHKCLVGAQ